MVCGAKLQGIEATYLAKKAGYYVIVADRNIDAPGSFLGDEFREVDMCCREDFLPLLKDVDVILPAMENLETLRQLQILADEAGIPMIFDMSAYEISRSKSRSNELFRSLGIPVPGTYPGCHYPVVCKPSEESGSAGVEIAHSKGEVDQYLREHSDTEVVVQEFLSGRSFSLEVIGDGDGHYVCPLITEVVVDEDYDCRRIIAPARISDDEKNQFMEIGRRLAESLNIRGIFDIEVIDDHGTLKILEIDARLPSQTPISVYQATGVNMVDMLICLFTGKSWRDIDTSPTKVCMYQQIRVQDGMVYMQGEHIMSQTSRLKWISRFFGADEAITDYGPERKEWRAITIVTGDDQNAAKMTYENMVAAILYQDQRNRISA